MKWGEITAAVLGGEIADIRDGKLQEEFGVVIGVSHTLQDGRKRTEVAFERADGTRSAYWEDSDEECMF